MKPSYDIDDHGKIRICDLKNQSATVRLDSQLNLTRTTKDSSTVANPPLETGNRMDTKSLNLTELLTEGYLTPNKRYDVPLRQRMPERLE